MTMVVEITDPTREQPIEGMQIDLDSAGDAATFVELFGDQLYSIACHLYPGESIKIECIDRVDDY